MIDVRQGGIEALPARCEGLGQRVDAELGESADEPGVPSDDEQGGRRHRSKCAGRLREVPDHELGEGEGGQRDVRSRQLPGVARGTRVEARCDSRGIAVDERGHQGERIPPVWVVGEEVVELVVGQRTRRAEVAAPRRAQEGEVERLFRGARRGGRRVREDASCLAIVAGCRQHAHQVRQGCGDDPVGLPPLTALLGPPLRLPAEGPHGAGHAVAVRYAIAHHGRRGLGRQRRTDDAAGVDMEVRDERGGIDRVQDAAVLRRDPQQPQALELAQQFGGDVGARILIRTEVRESDVLQRLDLLYGERGHARFEPALHGRGPEIWRRHHPSVRDERDPIRRHRTVDDGHGESRYAHRTGEHPGDDVRAGLVAEALLDESGSSHEVQRAQVHTHALTISQIHARATECQELARP